MKYHLISGLRKPAAVIPREAQPAMWVPRGGDVDRADIMLMTVSVARAYDGNQANGLVNRF